MTRLARDAFIMLVLLSFALRGQNVPAPTYTIQTLAGKGLPVSGPAPSMNLGGVGDLAVDSAGNIYAAITGGSGGELGEYDPVRLVVKIDPSGRLTRVAGNGRPGYGGDGGPATEAQLVAMVYAPPSLAVDARGNLFFGSGTDTIIGGEWPYRIRRVDAASGIITTIDGTDGVDDIAIDGAGNVYFYGDVGLAKVDAETGAITKLGGECGTVALDLPCMSGSTRIATDGTGNVYFSETSSIGRLDTRTGAITAVPAAQARFTWINDLAVDRQGNIYVADSGRISRIDAVTQTIATVAGDGTTTTESPDGAVVTSAPIGNPRLLTVDGAGNIYYVRGDLVVLLSTPDRIRRIDAATGVVSTVAGSGDMNFSGDGGPVVGAVVGMATAVATDRNGNVYIADADENRVRKVDATSGIITTIAGTGTPGLSGDGGAATAAQLYAPIGLAVDAAGNVFIADVNNHRVRKVDRRTGVISTTVLNLAPTGLAVDPSGNLWMSDGYTGAIHKRSASSGTLTTIQIPQLTPYPCPGGPLPWGLASDSAGNLFVADPGQYVIWKVAAGTNIPVVAAGAGCDPFQVGLTAPSGLALDKQGNLLFTTWERKTVEWVDLATRTWAIVAGQDNSFGYYCDGCPALLATMEQTRGIAVGPGGEAYVAARGIRVLIPTGGDPSGCSFTVSPAGLELPAGRSSLPISVHAAFPGCFWSVAGQPGWITPVPESGFGDATVTLGVASNVALSRSADFTLAGLPLKVSQDGGCSWSISPSARSFAADGGQAAINLTGCPSSVAWTISGTPDWVTFPYGGDLTYIVQPNKGPARTATLTVAGLPYAIQQLEAGTSSPGLRFVPVTPCRVVDTRDQNGTFGGPAMGAGSVRSFPIAESPCGIPSAAQAYSVNVTVVPRGMLPYLTLWPAGRAQPLVSTLNSWDGEVVANAAIVPAGSDGSIDVFTAGPTDVIIDVNGYFDSSDVSWQDAGPGAPVSNWFYPVAPCRMADTRAQSSDGYGGPSLSAGESRLYLLGNRCGFTFPGYNSASSLNVTVVPKTGTLGFLTIWPYSSPMPNVSTVNSWTGKVVANAAIVPADSVGVYATDPTDVILDANGYFAPGRPGTPGAMSFYPVTPCRIADTRNPVGPFGGPILESGELRSFQVPASNCGVPASAGAYALNVTVVPEERLGYLTIWPDATAQPFVSTLNSWGGSVVANAAIVPAGVSGGIRVYVTDRTHVIIDVNGYFAP